MNVTKSYTVEGRPGFGFPIDMLRSDRAWPATVRDVMIIAACLPAGAGGESVQLETEAKYAPNRARWKSFGWRVVD